MFAGGEIAIEDSRLFSARPIPEQRFLKKFQFLLCYGIRHSIQIGVRRSSYFNPPSQTKKEHGFHPRCQHKQKNVTPKSPMPCFLGPKVPRTPPLRSKTRTILRKAGHKPYLGTLGIMDEGKPGMIQSVNVKTSGHTSLQQSRCWFAAFGSPKTTLEAADVGRLLAPTELRHQSDSCWRKIDRKIWIRFIRLCQFESLVREFDPFTQDFFFLVNSTRRR